MRSKNPINIIQSLIFFEKQCLFTMNVSNTSVLNWLFGIVFLVSHPFFGNTAESISMAGQANSCSGFNSQFDSCSCEVGIIKEVDAVTGRTIIASKAPLVVSADGGVTGLSIYFLAVPGSLAMSIKAVGAGNCIDDSHKIQLLFTDGTWLELTNDGSFNCDAKFVLLFGSVIGKMKILKQLRSKEVAIMRVHTSQGAVERKFSLLESQCLVNQLDCILEQFD